MTRSTLADLQVIYQTSTERAVCVRETEDTPGGQRRSGSGAHCKGVATGKRLQGPGGMYGGPSTVWRPIATAPKDGTPIQARIPGHGEDNIIAWWGGLVGESGEECAAWTMAEDQEPPDCWTDGVCWAVNEDGLPSAQPTHWKPLYGGPRTAPEPEKEGTENDDDKEETTDAERRPNGFSCKRDCSDG